MRKTILKSKNLKLCTTLEEDFELLYEKLFSSEEVMRYVFGSELEKNEFKKLFYKEFNFNDIFGFSPIFLNNQIIGVGGIFVFEHKKDKGYEFGYILSKEHWGKGYATEIALAQKKHINSSLNSKAFATAHPINIASAKILQKCGLKAHETFKLKRGLRTIYTEKYKIYKSNLGNLQ